MSPFTASDRQLFEIIEWMHAAPSLAALHQTMLDGVAQLIRGDCYDMVLCGAAEKEENAFFAKPDTYTREEMAYMLKHSGDHPIARAFQKGAVGALSVSQFASHREWQSNHLFQEGGYRRLGLRYEMAVDIPGVCQQSLAVFSVVRGRPDFSERDREILTRLRPHLARAWIQAQRRSLPHSPSLVRHLFPQLSEREAEVLFWIIEGKQNSEIAAILERRLGTIQEHVENIIRKLGMENRHQMTVSVLRACRL